MSNHRATKGRLKSAATLATSDARQPLKRKLQVSALIALVAILSGFSYPAIAATTLKYVPIGNGWYQVFLCDDVTGCRYMGTERSDAGN